LCIELLDRIIQHDIATAFEFGQVLALVVEAKLSDKYDVMLRNLQLVQHVGLELPQQPSGAFLLPDAAQLIQLLIAKGADVKLVLQRCSFLETQLIALSLLLPASFEPARQLAALNGVSIDAITLEEARHMERDCVARELWANTSDRQVRLAF
jgi:hypothetical protein